MRVFSLLSLVLGFLIMLNASYLPVKAWLAEQLIRSSWQTHMQTGGSIKPWPWADTHPIALLNFQRIEKDIVVLNGGDPTTLAFSVGAVAPFNIPQSLQPFVVAGHRDSHFAFLQEVLMKDVITLTDNTGRVRLYQVEAMDIVDATNGELPLVANSEELVLITCYPFNGLGEETNERFVITAKPLD